MILYPFTPGPDRVRLQREGGRSQEAKFAGPRSLLLLLYALFANMSSESYLVIGGESDMIQNTHKHR